MIRRSYVLIRSCKGGHIRYIPLLGLSHINGSTSTSTQLVYVIVRCFLVEPKTYFTIWLFFFILSILWKIGILCQLGQRSQLCNFWQFRLEAWLDIWVRWSELLLLSFCSANPLSQDFIFIPLKIQDLKNAREKIKKTSFCSVADCPAMSFVFVCWHITSEMQISRVGQSATHWYAGEDNSLLGI